MTTKATTTAIRCARRTLAALALGSCALFAHAQSFEAFYGDVDSRDRGEDVKSVRHCPSGGSIVVGTRALESGGSEALATRVDNIGAPLWQLSYRIGDLDFSGANAVVELDDGSGFALTGNATRNDTRIWAMRITCEGKPLWTAILQNQSSPARGIGYDIIQLPGTNSTGTLGDLIVVGDERRSGGTTHGRIARLTLAGALVYDNAYIEPDTIPGLRFRAVTLARASTGLLTDLVVAGSAGFYVNWNFDRRGLMFRVRLDGTPVCNAVLGSSDSVSEDYSGVTPLTAPAFNGQTILVGATTSPTAGPTAGQQVYLTRFRSGNCAPLAQSHWPFPGESAEAFDAVEFNAAVGVAPRFAVTGSVRGANPSDGFLGWANVANLVPAIPLQRFGTQGNGPETLHALDTKTDRLVLAGATETDWQGSGDPGNFYLVQTDPSLRTQCSIAWTILATIPTLPYERFEPLVRQLDKPDYPDTPASKVIDAGYCCHVTAN